MGRAGILFQNLLFLKENTFRRLIFVHFSTLQGNTCRAPSRMTIMMAVHRFSPPFPPL
jgi:hypothetical protein